MGGPNPRGSRRPRVTTPLIEEHPTPNRPLGFPEAPGACPPAAVGGRVRCTRCPEKPASRPKAPSPVAGEQEDGVRRGRGIRGTWGGVKTAGGGARERASLGQAPRTCRTRPRGAHTCAARSAPRTCPQKMRLSAAGGSESSGRPDVTQRNHERMSLTLNAVYTGWCEKEVTVPLPPPPRGITRNTCPRH